MLDCLALALDGLEMMAKVEVLRNCPSSDLDGEG